MLSRVSVCSRALHQSAINGKSSLMNFYIFLILGARGPLTFPGKLLD